MRDLGKLAERFFGVWCSSVDLTANRSEIDKTGWDFFVEFPWKQDDSIAKDLLPSPIECKVQVKGTDQKKRAVPIPLSNLSRLIKAQMPAFFCLIDFEGKNAPQSVFLVHVDKSMIEKTLKRIRTLEFEKGDRRLNKHTINIKFGETDKLEEPFAESFKKAIEGYVVDGMEKYTEKKNELLKTLGFEDGAYKFRFTISAEDSITQIVDASLGLRSKVRVDSFDSQQVRFGIASDKPVFHGERGGLSFGEIKPTGKAIVSFKEYDFSPPLSFETRAYFSPLTHLLPEKFVKARLEGQFFQMIIEPSAGAIRYSFSLANPERSSLRGLRDILKVLTLFKKSKDGIILEIEIEPKSIPAISLKIFVNEDIADWSRGYEIAEMAVSICHRFGVSDNDVLVNIDDLKTSLESIVRFYQAINADPRKIVLTLDDSGGTIQETGKIIFILPFIETTVGSHTFGCLLGLEGIPIHLGEKQYKLIPDQLIIESLMVKKDGNFTDQDVIESKISDFAKKVAEDGTAPIILAAKPSLLTEQVNH